MGQEPGAIKNQDEESDFDDLKCGPKVEESESVFRPSRQANYRLNQIK